MSIWRWQASKQGLGGNESVSATSRPGLCDRSLHGCSRAATFRVQPEGRQRTIWSLSPLAAARLCRFPAANYGANACPLPPACPMPGELERL